MSSRTRALEMAREWLQDRGAFLIHWGERDFEALAALLERYAGEERQRLVHATCDRCKNGERPLIFAGRVEHFNRDGGDGWPPSRDPCPAAAIHLALATGGDREQG